MRILRIHILLALIVTCVENSIASAQTSNSQLSGYVRDATGAVLQAVTIRVFQGEAAEPVGETLTDAEGRFIVELVPGEYRLEASAPDFETIRQPVRVAPGLAPLVISLPLAPIEQIVEVSSDSEKLTADTTMSLTATTLTGDELLELPDNDEDLVAYLQLLAGADSSGDLEEDVLANFVIDGFNERRLPRPDEIAQIIIDPTTLSADGSGPRIEIITRPGTGRWRRSLNINFADESLNALTPGETSKPPRQTRGVNFDVSGPVIPNFLELDFEASTRNDERAGNSLRAVTPGGDIFSGIVLPQTQRRFAIEGEMSLASNHTLELGVDYGRRESRNSGVGGFSLMERGSEDASREWTFQISDRIFGDGFTNDFQIEIGRESSWRLPVSQGFAIDVADAFNGGGGIRNSRDRETTFQFENRLRLERGAWNFQIGGELRYNRSLSISEDNFNGTFDFASLHDYCYATGFAGINCLQTRTLVESALAAGVTPVYQDARGQEVPITGIPTTFTQASGNSEFAFSETGFDAYFQADKRFGERASLRLGARYEATNHSIDYWRINPTINLQYRLFENTLLSVGSQLTFRDFREYERLLRNDGSTYRREITISTPSFPNPFQSGELVVNEQTTSVDVLDPDYQSPYNISPQVSLNQQLPGLRFTATYGVNVGIHQQRVRNINAPYPGTPLPDDILNLPRDVQRDIVDRMRPFFPIVGNIRQIESTGRSLNHNLRLRLQPQGNLELMGLRLGGNLNYNYRFGEDDNDFTNPYLRAWGVSQSQHQFQSQFRVRMPEEQELSNGFLQKLAALTYQNTVFNFNFRASTGRLYSITTGRDLNGDQSSRDRPFGVARNTETGPGSWNLDLTFTKEIPIASSDPVPEFGNLLPPQRGGNGGGGGGGFSRGDGQGGGWQSRGDDDEKTLRFQVRVNNLLNHSQPRAYSGVLSSPLFGQPTGYTGGRTITLGLRFDF